MRVKLDENLPAELAEDLRRLGHVVDTVADEGLQGQPDPLVAPLTSGFAGSNRYHMLVPFPPMVAKPGPNARDRDSSRAAATRARMTEKCVVSFETSWENRCAPQRA